MSIVVKVFIWKPLIFKVKIVTRLFILYLQPARKLVLSPLTWQSLRKTFEGSMTPLRRLF